jgi:hypothetical protein
VRHWIWYSDHRAYNGSHLVLTIQTLDNLSGFQVILQPSCSGPRHLKNGQFFQFSNGKNKLKNICIVQWASE